MQSLTPLDGCGHYKRFCQVKAPCCDEYYVCRKCHDEANDHIMDSLIVTEMKCLLCNTEQTVSNKCINPMCATQMGNYYCDICHLFENRINIKLWHCHDCGICVRPIDSCPDTIIAHCFECNGCDNVNHTTHINRDNNCPVCLESLKISDLVVIKPGQCTHLMHEVCYREYRSHGNYNCPVCSKTFSFTNVDILWATIDREILLQPMPEGFKDLPPVTFLCNDCNTKEQATLNLIGYKCSQCGGYNTVKV